MGGEIRSLSAVQQASSCSCYVSGATYLIATERLGIHKYRFRTSFPLCQRRRLVARLSKKTLPENSNERSHTIYGRLFKCSLRSQSRKHPGF